MRKRKILIISGIILLLIFLFSGIKYVPADRDDSRIAGIKISQIPSNSLIPTSDSRNLIPSTMQITNLPKISQGEVMTEAENSDTELFLVEKVVDGDTIRLEGSVVVRYVGIDTPESVDPRKPVQCFAKEASDKNRELVEGKKVKLVKDISETDKYGRLLRYIYLGDEMVNEILVRNGFAYASSYPPDVKYQEKFRQAEQEARENNRGLWGAGCSLESQVQKQPAAVFLNGNYVCDCSKSCSKISSCVEAQYQLTVCGCTARDGDGDGLACESSCQ